MAKVPSESPSSSKFEAHAASVLRRLAGNIASGKIALNSFAIDQEGGSERFPYAKITLEINYPAKLKGKLFQEK